MEQRTTQTPKKGCSLSADVHPQVTKRLGLEKALGTDFAVTVEEELEQIKTPCSIGVRTNGGGTCLRIPRPRATPHALLTALDLHLPEALPHAEVPESIRKMPPKQRKRRCDKSLRAYQVPCPGVNIRSRMVLCQFWFAISAWGSISRKIRS